MTGIHKIIILFLSIIVLAACSGKKKNQQAGISKADSNSVIISDSSLMLMDVQLSKPDVRLIESNIYLAGKVIAAPNNRASVSSDMEGKVERIFVNEGDFVKKG